MRAPVLSNSRLELSNDSGWKGEAPLDPAWKPAPPIVSETGKFTFADL
jgi:hypothetical protein